MTALTGNAITTLVPSEPSLTVFFSSLPFSLSISIPRSLFLRTSHSPTVHSHRALSSPKKAKRTIYPLQEKQEKAITTVPFKMGLHPPRALCLLLLVVFCSCVNSVSAVSAEREGERESERERKEESDSSSVFSPLFSAFLSLSLFVHHISYIPMISRHCVFV